MLSVTLVVVVVFVVVVVVVFAATNSTPASRINANFVALYELESSMTNDDEIDCTRTLGVEVEVDVE